MANARKILLVGEDAALRARFEQAFSGKGIEVAGVPSGEEALWQLEREPCDAVFAAAALAGMSGLELAEEARALQDGLPVYLLGGGGADFAESLPAMPAADALAAIAARLAPLSAAAPAAPAAAAADSRSRLKDIVLFLLAPLVALGYVLAFPIVGFVMLIYSAFEAKEQAGAQAAPAAAAAPRQGLLKALGMMLAVGVLGVLYGLVAPILGIMLVLWFGMEAWGKLGKKAVTRSVVAAALLAGASLLWHGHAEAQGKRAKPAPAAAAQTQDLSNQACLGCHGKQGFSAAGADGKPRSLHLVEDRFGRSVHGKRNCVECHADITEIPHKPGVTRTVNCVNCHDSLWKKARADGTAKEHARLGVVVEQIDHYMKSVHARARRDDQKHANAICYDCHAPHYVFAKGSPERAEWHLSVPDVCGKCHAKERGEYAKSVHGKAALEGKNSAAAVCSSCHTTHDVADPSKDDARLAITKNCGGCHVESLKSYVSTYHGQVNTLGYAYTAKCFDCHGSHGILRTSDAASPVHPANRLQTCQKCHAGATAGLTSFEPHGTPHNFARYPAIWLASKFLLVMIAGTFVFFWSHTALWFYREYQERKARIARPHVRAAGLGDARLQGKQLQRFPVAWRMAHLLFALSLMMLVMTGMSVLYADTPWAQAIIHALGGPKVAAVIHRTFAVLFLVVFVGHLVHLVVYAAQRRGSFDWFGPDSLAPRAQDLRDILAMFRWFIGQGPRPVFDRWTYWQKFDYWAPFSVVLIVSACGLMLWAATKTTAILPGWVLNVATIFHGEMAVLAVLFLFTVHFFNNHFRPDKFPLELVMFTGSMPLETFKREHRLEYNRLVAAGELDKYLVDAPTAPMTRASKALGFALIAFGLLLLVLVLIGLFRDLGG
jgi:CheY-like chemotaxis protein/cytochrome b subunit of formate dehydrogenase